MLFSTRLLKGIAAAATIIVAQAAGATAQHNNVDEFGVPINADGTIIPERGIKEIAKAEFVEFLDSKSESLLIQFYDTDIDESKAAMEEYEVFAEKAAVRYPDLVVRKVNYKKDNYLTARLLLMQIPELRLLIKGEVVARWPGLRIQPASSRTSSRCPSGSRSSSSQP
ncbi:hypothetical protein DL89DRAFT_124559 [Linderina pennispora]|uniref:Thioredoxin domain-containing protein n=1 Tax=Linderina pennispora TaxID=61395 RepID=A0A1Y1WCX1_9FUNG|nr:uncharacterized protein DL89DRAFT_124559 [Linderina pennispora]ORX71371.1 hypothetical protein DL89DRAFT_124559 [Linderina pennispora]